MKLNFRFPCYSPTGDAGGADGKGGTDGKGADGKGTGDAAAQAAAAAAAAAAATGGTDGKGGTAGKDGTAGTEGKEGDKPKAPEKYALQLPDGGRILASDLPKLEAIARANDWTNEEAQAFLAERDADIKAQSDAWTEETKADTELGGDKLPETQKRTMAAIDRIYPKDDPLRAEFLAFLGRGGIGNNIHVVRTLYRIGKMTGEDTATGGQSGGEGEAKPLAERIYPNAPKG